MRLDLDTEIRYPIGERVGVLRQVVLNETGQVQAVVMATDDLVSRNVIVPVELLSEEPGGVLTLNASPEDVDEMEDYNEQLVPMVPEGWQMSEDPAPGGEVFPDLYQPVIPVAEVPNLAEGL